MNLQNLAGLNVYERGQKAYRVGIEIPAHDKVLLESYSKVETEETSFVPVCKEWLRGWQDEQEKDLRKQFPEMY